MTKCRKRGYTRRWTHAEIGILALRVRACKYYKTITIPNRSDRAVYIMIHRLKLYKTHLNESTKIEHKRLKKRECMVRYRQKLKARELS